jgi:hypothetical protein
VGITQVGERSRGVGVTQFSNHSRVKEKRHGFRIAGGVLTIIATAVLSIALFISWVMAINALSYLAPQSPSKWPIIVAFLDAIAFAFGIAGGVLALKRKALAITIFGTVLVMVAGVLAFIPLNYGVSGSYDIHTWIIGFPVFLLSLFGLIFTSVAFQDFKRP